MVSIALCMIAKSEENFIANAIESVKSIVNEIIVIDTGSADKTKEIAKKSCAKVYDFEWNNDFAEAKNYAKSKTKKDWILFLDADECISKKDIKEIKDIIKKHYKIFINLIFMEERQKHFYYTKKYLHIF